MLSQTVPTGAKRRYYCASCAIMGSFMTVLALGYFITNYGDKSVHFPDFFSIVCMCLSEESECNEYAYSCKWAPPSDLANNAIAAPSCTDSTPETLATMSAKDGMFLVCVVLIAIIGAPFQLHVSAYWCGGSDELYAELDAELDAEADELLALKAEIQKIHPSQKDKRLKLYAKFKKKKEEYQAEKDRLERMDSSQTPRGDHQHLSFESTPKNGKGKKNRDSDSDFINVNVSEADDAKHIAHMSSRGESKEVSEMARL